MALVDYCEAGDRLAQRPPAAAGKNRETHHVGEPREIVFGGIKVSVSVKPHDAKVLAGTDAGCGAQAADVVARQHQWKREAGASSGDVLGEASIELEGSSDFGQVLIDGRDALRADLPARIRQAGP